MSDLKAAAGPPSPVRRTCPRCASEHIRTIPVSWYPELEYLSCGQCQHVWTIERTPEQSRPIDQSPESPVIGIVDDDEGGRRALDNLLRSAGYRTVLFDSAEIVLASETIQQIDCLIVDYEMVGSGGLQIQQPLTMMRHVAPIIIASAHTDDIRDRARTAGAFAVIAKPCSPSDILDAIHAALDSTRRRQP
jgi:CheY-like chemotaxis protein